MYFFRISSTSVFFLFVMIALTACGGGDGGSSTSASKPTAVETTPTPVAATTLPTTETKPPVTPVTETAPEVVKQTCPDIHPQESLVAIGDSLTKGVGDNIASDNVTVDGCYKGRGYPPVLINKLNQDKGRKHVVVNRGVSGAKSGDGANNIGSLISGESMHVLVLYGTNDSYGPTGENVTKEQFDSNMRKIIQEICNAGKTAYLAKIPPVLGERTTGVKYADTGVEIDAGRRNVVIQTYNGVIGGLQGYRCVKAKPIDLYNYFKNKPDRYADNLHLNGRGYQDVANLWWQELRRWL